MPRVKIKKCAGNLAWLGMSPTKRKNENEIARIEGVQCVLTGTNSVLLHIGEETQMARYLTYARCQVGNTGDKLETGAKTDHA